MSAIVSIELLLDAATEAAVRAEWDALAAAGVSSLAGHTAVSNRPHITVLVRPALDPFEPRAALGQLPMPVTLGAPVLFGSGDRRVLVRSVIPTEQLLSLHAAVHASVPPGDDAPRTDPGQWTPHVTLARRIRLADLPVALRCVEGDLAGDIVTMRRWDAASATVTMLG